MRANQLVLGILIAIALICMAFFCVLLKPAWNNFQRSKSRVVQTATKPVNRPQFSITEEQEEPPIQEFPDDLPGDFFIVPVRPLVALSGASKEKVFELRKEAVAASPFARKGYEPSNEVFGQIVSGKPWIAANACSTARTHQNYTQGPSEETRFINNPTALIAVEHPFSYRRDADWCTKADHNLLMQQITYDKLNREITVTYLNFPFPTYERDTFYDFNGVNARDLGYPYMYVDLQRSTYKLAFLNPSNASTEVAQLQNFIHVGGSCGVKGGCNNGSPRQPMLEFHEDPTASTQDREIYIKLWKEKPASVEDPADMVERIIIRGKPNGETWVNQTDQGTSTVTAQNIPDVATRRLSHVLSQEDLADPSKLFSNGFQAVRAIKEAEEEYAKTHGHFTADITELGLGFENVAKQVFVDGASRIYLENGIYYVLTDKLVAVYFNQPKREAQFYHLDFYFDGTQQCVAKATRAQKTCEQLGGTNPRPNSRIKSWVIYDLPSNFLK